MDTQITRVEASGLPIDFDRQKQVLRFVDGLTCAGSSFKKAGQMRNLLFDARDLDEEEPYYGAYRDICFDNDRQKFLDQDTRYDITAIRPGTINGEFKKTSGHFHGYIPGTSYTYPEVYEVLQGRAAFVMQKSTNNDKDEELRVDEVRIVVVERGQSIVIPPFYGHGSINIGDDMLLFSNLAIVSCPLDYESVASRHGLAYFLVEADNADGFEAVPNLNYVGLPPATVVRPTENPALGITFGKPSYQSYVEDPKVFAYLSDPTTQLADIDSLTNPEN